MPRPMPRLAPVMSDVLAAEIRRRSWLGPRACARTRCRIRVRSLKKCSAVAKLERSARGRAWRRRRSLRASRAGRCEKTMMRSPRKIASSTSWVTKITVLASRLLDAAQFDLEALAPLRVEGAERLVHQQARRSRRRACGRWRCAGACRPRRGSDRRRRSRSGRPDRDSAPRRVALLAGGQVAAVAHAEGDVVGRPSATGNDE